MSIVDTAVIGAGPYGLSVSAHLAGRGLNVRTFGVPMESWRRNMPAGMFLKSEGFASNLYARDGAFPLAEFCRTAGIEYADIGVPVALDTFVAYGEAFAKKFVSPLDTRRVAQVRRTDDGFELELEDGARQSARTVVVAVGLTYAKHVPAAFADLPAELCGHSADYRSFEDFAGRDATVIGGGASAVDSALALRAAGANVRIVSRHELAFHSPPELGKRSWYQRLRYPVSGLGKNWKAYLYAEMPHLFYRLPRNLRVKIARSALGPAPGWFTKAGVTGKIDVLAGVACRSAEVRDGRVHLNVENVNGGQARRLETDFVLTATGFASDVTRVPFLHDLLPSVRLFEKTPVLSPNLESSVPGLYFAGVTAMDNFGPVLRFAFGARFTAERLAARIPSTVRGKTRASAARIPATRPRAAEPVRSPVTVEVAAHPAAQRSRG